MKTARQVISEIPSNSPLAKVDEDVLEMLVKEIQREASQELARILNLPDQLRAELETCKGELAETVRRLDIAQASLNAGQPTCAHCRGEIGVILTTLTEQGLKDESVKRLTAENLAFREVVKNVELNYVKVLVFLQRCKCSCYYLNESQTHVECERCKTIHQVECMKNEYEALTTLTNQGIKL